MTEPSTQAHQRRQQLKAACTTLRDAFSTVLERAAVGSLPVPEDDGKEDIAQSVQAANLRRVPLDEAQAHQRVHHFELQVATNKMVRACEQLQGLVAELRLEQAVHVPTEAALASRRATSQRDEILRQNRPMLPTLWDKLSE